MTVPWTTFVYIQWVSCQNKHLEDTHHIFCSQTIIWSKWPFIISTFYYSLFLILRLNRYKLFLFPWLFIHQVLFFGVLKIDFKIFAQYFFCWLLTCVYHIHWIIYHWSWKLSVGVVSNCQWDVSKLYIYI